MKSGGPGSCGRLIAISTGNSLPSLRMAGSSTGCPTIRPSPGRHVALDAPAVRLAQVRRDDQLGQLAADHLLGRVAERLLGGAVDLDDHALGVHRDDAVEGRVEDGLEDGRVVGHYAIAGASGSRASAASMSASENSGSSRLPDRNAS